MIDKNVLHDAILKHTLDTIDPTKRISYFEMSDSFMTEFVENPMISNLSVEKVPYFAPHIIYEMIMEDDEGTMVLMTLNLEQMQKLAEYLLQEVAKNNG